MEGLAQKLKIKLLNLMSRCLVLAGSMHFRAWSGGFVISPVEYLPLWGLQPCLHGLWLLVLKWVCVISLIQFRKICFMNFHDASGAAKPFFNGQLVAGVSGVGPLDSSIPFMKAGIYGSSLLG